MGIPLLSGRFIFLAVMRVLGSPQPGAGGPCAQGGDAGHARGLRGQLRSSLEARHLPVLLPCSPPRRPVSGSPCCRRQTPDLLFPARSCLGETGTFHRNCGFGMLISLSLDLCKRDGFTLPMTPTLSELVQIIDRLFVWCVDSRTPPMKVADPVEGVPTVRF